jgi:hypothetical protein
MFRDFICKTDCEPSEIFFSMKGSSTRRNQFFTFFKTIMWEHWKWVNGINNGSSKEAHMLAQIHAPKIVESN